jgi:dTDP-4-amino-4,6-dideoxygalactose transaminase
MTTGGGGMILTNDDRLAEKARYLTTQAKDDPVRYIHDEIGYNFRLTNIQAALGVAQLEQLSGFLVRRKTIYSNYVAGVKDINGLSIAAVPEYAENNHWINILQIDPEVYGRDRETLMSCLEAQGIQARPVWYANHIQKPFIKCQTYKMENAEKLIENSLCLPSSNQLKEDDILQIVSCL